MMENSASFPRVSQNSSRCNNIYAFTIARTGTSQGVMAVGAEFASDQAADWALYMCQAAPAHAHSCDLSWEFAKKSSSSRVKQGPPEIGATRWRHSQLRPS